MTLQEQLLTRYLRAIYREYGRTPPEPLASDLAEHKATIDLFLSDPQVTAGELHEAWVGRRKAAGFTLGRKIDLVAKTHPQIKPWGDLPPADRHAEEAGLEYLREMYQKQQPN